MGCRERTETGQAPVVDCMAKCRQENARERRGSDAVGKRRRCRTSQTWQHNTNPFSRQQTTLHAEAVPWSKNGRFPEGLRPAFRRCDPEFCGWAGKKKSPDHYKMLRGCPGLSTYRRRFSDPRRKAVSFQAGILTPGSSSHRVFPTEVSDCSAMFVPGYSGGPVSDFHGVPNYSPKGT